MYGNCRNTDCEETASIETLAPGDWQGGAVDGELSFCSLACLIDFCQDESNFPVSKNPGDTPQDEILIYQPDLELDTVVEAVDAG